MILVVTKIRFFGRRAHNRRGLRGSERQTRLERKGPQEAFGTGLRRPTSCGFREVWRVAAPKSFGMSGGYFR